MSTRIARRVRAEGGQHRAAVGALAVSVLGPVRVQRNGIPIDLGGRRPRAILARLVVAGGDVVPADRLIDALWGERPPPGAVAALHAHVSHLRRRLEPDRPARDRHGLIVSADPGYAVQTSAGSVDAWWFERLVTSAARAPRPADSAATLERALSLWRGPAYADLAGTDWAQAAADRLAQTRALARERLLAARLALGENASLIPEIELLIAEEPFREERWRLLALAAYRAHRQADALDALRRARQVLAEELGVEPGPALRALEADVLTQSPDLDEVGRWPDPRDRAHERAPDRVRLPVQRQAPSADRPTLIERNDAIGDLATAVGDTLAGRPRVVLIEGAAGSGRSRLLTEVRELAAAAGARVLTAGARRTEQSHPFGVARQLLDPVVRSANAAGRSASARRARSVLDAAATEQQTTRPGTHAEVDALYRAVASVCSDQQPVVLAVDDAQWCDSASLRWLTYLVPRVDGLPILIAVSVLTDGDDAPAPGRDVTALDELAMHDSAVIVRPQPLGPDGVETLVRRELGAPVDAAFVHACSVVTGGNPLLLARMLRALRRERVVSDAEHADTAMVIGARVVTPIRRRWPVEFGTRSSHR